MTTVLQTAKPVKTDEQPQPIAIPSMAFVWGMQDAMKGVSRYEGYMFFCGYLLRDYMRGHMHGHAIAAHQQQRTAEMPAEFAGALADYAQGIRYCAPDTNWEAVEDEQWGE